VLVVAALMGVISRLVWELLNGLVGTSLIGQIVSVGGAIAAGGGFYIWAIGHMRVPEWQQIESMIAGRLRPQR
jgi:hypothetical protein